MQREMARNEAGLEQKLAKLHHDAVIVLKLTWVQPKTNARSFDYFFEKAKEGLSNNESLA